MKAKIEAMRGAREPGISGAGFTEGLDTRDLREADALLARR